MNTDKLKRIWEELEENEDMGRIVIANPTPEELEEEAAIAAEEAAIAAEERRLWEEDNAAALQGPHAWEGRYYEEYEPSPYDGTYSEE